MRWSLVLGLVAAGLAACVTAPKPEPDLVDATTVVPGLVTEIRYQGSENFMGRPADGYERPVCLLSRPAAQALAGVQQELHGQALGLKVFDCYRPARAVAHFARWAADISDQANKARYYPEVDKRDLFKEGYIAERSGHSRGSTVDLTIVSLVTGGPPAELDMGTPWDLFSPLSWPSSTAVGPEAQANRRRLAEVMARHGFRPLQQEWWHFTLAAEPYPDRYFDVPVR